MIALPVEVQATTKKVLVVDDETRILGALRDLLEDEFSVLTAGGADEGLEILEDNRDDVAVILCDQRMPGMSGDEFLQRARELSEATRILITGYADLQALVRAVNHGQIYGYVSKPWDPMELEITVRKAADHFDLVRALKESEERFRNVFDNAPIGMALVDADSRFLRVNKSICSMLGFTEKELQELTYADLLHPEERAEGLEDAKELIKGSHAGLHVEKRFLKQNGEILWADVTAARLADRFTFGLAMLVNITERKAAEEQARQSQKMEAIGRLAGGVAHDFNNLLTAIGGYAELLKPQVAAKEGAVADLGEIEKAAERASSLTRQLLTFSRRQVVSPTVLSLNSVVGDMQKMLRRLISENIELVTIQDPDLGHIEADRGQVEQIVLNLAVNARDAMPEGGKLVIETANVVVDERLLSELTGAQLGPCVVLSVRDTGAGMDAGTRAKIFEPFFTTKEIGKGTGLGLATVYGIVRQSNGFIRVESEPGEGTTFWIYFPRVQNGSLSEVQQIPSHGRVVGSETILLVEDEETVRQLARRILENCGYRVLTARGSEEALRICEEPAQSIALMLTDVVMPKMSGRELAQKVSERHPEIKIVYISGYSEESAPERLDGAADFLSKPFTAEALAAKVRGVLDRDP